jgi:hypothetical protein
MLTCPHCHSEIHLRELPYQGFFESFRECPNCGGNFIADPDTKRRQAILLVLLFLLLAMSLLLYFRGTTWLIPTIVIFAILGFIFYRGNKLMFLVPYQKGQTTTDDT